VRRKEFKKRNSGKLTFYIGKDIAFAVKQYGAREGRERREEVERCL
jgi:hypothetical protein